MSSNRRRKKDKGKEDDFDLIKKVIDSNLISRKEDDRRMSNRKKIEAKLDELHVTGTLRRLIGAIPYTSNGDDDWKKEKEAYLMEKYGK